jgi:hypothetical protein
VTHARGPQEAKDIENRKAKSGRASPGRFATSASIIMKAGW